MPVSAFRRFLPLVLGRLALVAAALMMLVPAVSAAPLTIGKIGLGGPGCPAGSATAAITADGHLSIRFRQYRVSAGGARSFDRKACGLTIPVSAPAGMSVAIVGVQYKGFNRLPPGAKSTISAEIFFAGGRGPIVSRSFTGPLNRSFTHTSAASATVWSECGADFNLRINSSLRVMTSGGRAASASIRSQDVGAALLYQLRFRRC
jgi:hypothetical protein